MPPEILLNAMRCVIRGCQQCLEQNGAQFEQFRRKNYIVIFIVRINVSVATKMPSYVIHGLLRIKFYLGIPNAFIYFLFSECAIFLNSE
jgi:hypothetical protein